jgi:SAM-dependent methyltransferase
MSSEIQVDEACLPENWVCVLDSKTQERWYVNEVTRTVSRERPGRPDVFEVARAASGCAYVWLLMNGHDYVSGVLVSMWSVRRTQTCAKLVVMVTPDVAEWVRELLELVADSVVCVEYIKSPCIPLNTPRKEQLYARWYDTSFTKWRALELSAYRKVLLMDADTVVTRSIDELFLLSAPGGTFSSPWHAPWNAQARRPNPFRDFCHADFVTHHQVREALERGSVCIGTSVLLSPLGEGERDAFERWLASESRPSFGYPGCSSMFDEQAICGFYLSRGVGWSYIDQSYNAIPWKVDSGWLRGREPSVLHYFGSVKPWRMGGGGRVEERDGSGSFEDFARWDEIAKELVAEVPHVGCAVVFSERTKAVSRKRSRTERVAGPVKVIFEEEGVAELEAAAAAEVSKEADVAGKYDRTALFKRGELRDESDMIELRRTNNFAKIGLNVAAVNLWKLRTRRDDKFSGLRIFDVACGTGGDVGKFLKSASDSGCKIRSYLAADVSAESVKACAERLLKARREVPESGAAVVDLGRRDVFHVLPPWAKLGSFHIASCQFALHYFFESEGSLRTLARSVGRLLAPGGVFLCICADGEEISRVLILDHARRRHASCPPATTTSVPYGRVQIKPSEETMRRLLRLSASERRSEPGVGPFGMDYEFSLGSHVQGVREFIVCRRTLDRVFSQEAHLHRILDVSLPEMILRMRAKANSTFWESVARKMGLRESGDLDVETHLYRAYVYVKDESDGETSTCDEVGRTQKAFVNFLFGCT